MLENVLNTASVLEFCQQPINPRLAFGNRVRFGNTALKPAPVTPNQFGIAAAY